MPQPEAVDPTPDPVIGPASGDAAVVGVASRVLVIGCGALTRELVELTRPLPHVDVTCLPPSLHDRPGGIPGAVRAKISAARVGGRYGRIFVAYADCGTGGLLDAVLAEEGVDRLPGAHCYESFAGRVDFARLAEEEPATFWLTDFLARNFQRLVIRGLGIDRYPELESMYFGNYRRLVYLSQTDDADLLALARRAAERLGLTFEHRHTGYGEVATSIATAATAATAGAGAGRPFAADPTPAAARPATGAGRPFAADPTPAAARPATGAGRPFAADPTPAAARPAIGPGAA